MTFDELKDQILALFPIGSEWYDCGQDTFGAVVLHFKPRGIILRSSDHRDLVRFDQLLDGDLVRFGYDQLLDGQLVAPRAHPGTYEETDFAKYRERQRQMTDEYLAALAAAGLNEARVWGDR
jgi:hypothetical protein